MKEKLYGSEDIIKKFRYLEGEIKDLACKMAKCCLKEPVNIGGAIELYEGYLNGKWRFKTLEEGSNITITDTGSKLIISSTGGGGSFNCNDLLNCSTSNLPEGSNLYFTDQRAVDALTGQNISIFNNNVPYITATEFPLTATQIAFGDGSNLLTSSPNLVFDGNVLQVTTNGSSSGWGQVSSVISSSSSEAGLSLYNTGTGGHIYNLISTSNDSGIGGGKFSIGDATTSQNIFEYSSSTNEYTFPLLGGSGDVVVFANNTGTLYTGTIPSVSLPDTYVGFGNVANQVSGSSNFIYDTTNLLFDVGFDTPTPTSYFKLDVNNSYYSIGDFFGKIELSLGNIIATSTSGVVLNLDRALNSYSIGANGFDFNTHIFIDDTVNKNITLNADNGVIVSNLSGGTTEMVVADNTGLLSKQAIPSGYISSVSNTSTINLTVSTGNLTADFASMNISQFTNDSGYLTSAVTSVSALTIGTTGTDLSSTVANSTTTPVITLNVPTASATNRGALSSADWSTFNSKEPAITWAQGDILYGTGVNTYTKLAKNTSATRYLSNTGSSNNPAWAQIDLSNGVTGNLPVTNLNSGTSASSSTFWRGDGTWASPSVSSLAISSLTAAAANNTINNANYIQEWQWNSLDGNSGLKLSASTTAASSNLQRVFEISLSGANSTSTQTTYGSYITNTHTGTSSTNVAGYFSASGGTNNYGLIVNSGFVGIGTSTPAYLIDAVQNQNGISRFRMTNSDANSSASIIWELINNSSNSLQVGIASSTNTITGVAGESFIQMNTGNMLIRSISGYIRFNTGVSGTNERMRILSTGEVGVGLSAPTSTLQVNGSFAPSIVAKTGSYTLTSSDYTVTFNGTSLTATLPTASGCPWRIYCIINYNATSLTVSTYKDLTNSNATSLGANSVLWLQSDGTVWRKIN